MTGIDDLERDVQDISNNVLGDLSTEERIRMFAREAANDNDERLEQLADTAPKYEYTATDLEYLNGIKKLGAVSLQARHALQSRYQAITEHETTRDAYIALMLVNESLSRLSRGAFDIDEFGHFDAPEHENADYDYDKTHDPGMSYLATKYRELWEDVPAELLVDEDDREIKYFPNLSALGSLAYPDDLSAGTFDDLEKDRIESDVYLTEVRLMKALVEFRTRFHGWRLFAEEYLEISLDELLNISKPEHEGGVMHGVATIDESLCENTLSLKRDYLEAYPSLLEEWADEMGEDAEEIEANLDERARNFAEGIADAVDLPGVAPDA